MSAPALLGKRPVSGSITALTVPVLQKWMSGGAQPVTQGIGVQNEVRNTT